jgi:hypothetical protein
LGCAAPPGLALRCCLPDARPNRDDELKSDESNCKKDERAHMPKTTCQGESETRQGGPSPHCEQVQEEPHG